MSKDITFKDLTIVDPIYGEDDPDGMLQKRIDARKLDEVMTTAQRQKAKMNMRRNKSRIQMGIKRAKNRRADAEKLKARARRAARNLIAKRILKNKSKGDLSYAARASLEKQIARRSKEIDTMSKRLLLAVRRKEAERISKRK